MLLSETDEDILASVRGKFHAMVPKRLGVAVSGGGDSVALLHVLSRCFEAGQVELFAATVDHGLRREATREAEGVAELAAGMDIPHEILTWSGWDGTGNLQDQARRARYRLLGGWARAKGIAILTTGHTADDQAETVLMRLARSAGVSGLAGIPERRTIEGITVLRPFLNQTRAALRQYLVRNDLTWVEDPSNQDERFERIRMRRALEALEPLGLTVDRLSTVAQNMAQAREALDWYTFLAAQDLSSVQGGDIVLDQRRFRTLPGEIGRRLLVRAINWVSHSDYPPRSAPLRDLMDAVRRGRSMTLSGCIVLHQGGSVWVAREYSAVAQKRCKPGEIWDNRWRMMPEDGRDTSGLDVRALGRAGLAHCPDARATGLPVPVLQASPSVWRGGELIAAPLAGMPAGWAAQLVYGGEEFFASLLSH